MVAVQGGGYQHVAAEVGPGGLAVLDQLAEHGPAVEAVRHLPAELRQDVEQGARQVRHAQVQDEEVHPVVAPDNHALRLALPVCR